MAPVPDAVLFERLRRAESIGRPLGDDAFFDAAPSQADQARLEASAARRRRAKKVERTVTVIP
jgi:hypothetical protein